MAGESPPEGWYDDPSGEPVLRYWDGASWTADTAQTPARERGEADDAVEAAKGADDQASSVPRRIVSVSRESDSKLALKVGGSISWLYGNVLCHDRSVDRDTVRYVIASPDRRPAAIFVDGGDADSIAILDALPVVDSPQAVEKALAELEARRQGRSKLPPIPRLPGRFDVDGSVVTIIMGDDRHDLVNNVDEMPTIRNDEETTDAGLAVELIMPGAKRATIVEVTPEHVEDTRRALAVVKAAGRAKTKGSGTVRWQYKVIRNMTANRLEESLNQLGGQGWELVALAGLDGVVSLTGNKLYAVLKRRR